MVDMKDLMAKREAEKATANPPLQNQDERRVEEGGPDEAFSTRHTAGGGGNTPANQELLESVETGAEVQTELNEASNVAAVESAILSSAEVVDTSEGKTWTSHPIARFSLGRFQFEAGTLKLTDPEEIEEFEKLLNHKHLSARDRAVVKEVDSDRANEIAKQFVESRKTSGITHSETGDTK